MDYDFINNYTESFTVTGNDYTIIDSLNLETGSFNTRKISYNSYVNGLNSVINSNINSDIDLIENNINLLINNIGNKFDKRGLSFNSNEKITGPLSINSKLSVNSFADFNSTVNLKFNKIVNLSVISPVDDYDGINKQYVDTLLSGYETPNVSNFIIKTGDTMTGVLNLISSTPTNNFYAVHKKYVDDKQLELTQYVPLSGEVSLTGHVNLLLSNSNASTKKYVDDKLIQANYVLKTGANVIGELFVLPLTNTSNNFISNKKYVDDTLSTALSVVSTTGSSMTSTFNVFDPFNLDITDPNLAVSKFYVDSIFSDNNPKYLLRSGGSLTGELFLDGSYTVLTGHAITKQYVDSLEISKYLPISGGTVEDLTVHATETNYNTIIHSTNTNITLLSTILTYYVSLEQDCTGFTINYLDPNQVYYFNLFIRQKGSYNIIWNVNNKNVRWEDQDLGPSISNRINNIDVFSLIHMNGEWFGINGGQQYI